MYVRLILNINKPNNIESTDAINGIIKLKCSLLIPYTAMIENGIGNKRKKGIREFIIDNILSMMLIENNILNIYDISTDKQPKV
ncbi:MAG: hypothetical protein DRO92_00870 [Candidatus Altiarchaeales archaeon]|nr:MAG: hypothetical protein DRO92_00870 [Candidatus Altiarchaeales archaeon]